jgi:site-specific DNA recombinase
MTTAQAGAVKAAIYCRISDADDPHGVKGQEKDCRAACADHGWPVADVYVDDDVSASGDASRKPRPEYDRMLRDIRRGAINLIVTTEPERLTRRPPETEAFIAMAEQVGFTDIFFESEDSGLSMSDGGGLHRMRQYSNDGAKESWKISRRTKRAERHNAEAGHRHGGGKRGYGYTADGKTWAIFEIEAVNIRDAARRVIEGESLNSIERDWERRRILTSTGRLWSGSKIRDVLISARVNGQREHLGTLYPNSWLAILDDATWLAVRAVLLNPARRTNASMENRQPYPLRGVLRCAYCGELLVATPRGGKRMYGCKRRSTARNACGGVIVVADYAERYVFELVQVVADNPALSNILTLERAEDEAEYNRLLAEKAAAAGKRATYADMLAKDDMDPPTYARLDKEQRARIAATEVQLAELRGSSVLDRMGGQVAAQWETFTAEEQRTIVDAVLTGVTVYKGRGRTFEPMRLHVAGWRHQALSKSPELAVHLDTSQLTIAAGTYTIEDVGTITVADAQAKALTDATKADVLATIDTLPVPVAIAAFRAAS